MTGDEDRQRLRNELGDDFADLSEAKDALWGDYERDPDRLDELQQAVLDTWVLDGLVGNGGFDCGFDRRDTVQHQRCEGCGC